MRRIQRAIFRPFTITGRRAMSFTLFFLSFGVSKIFEPSKLVLTGSFIQDQYLVELLEIDGFFL